MGVGIYSSSTLSVLIPSSTWRVYWARRKPPLIVLGLITDLVGTDETVLTLDVTNDFLFQATRNMNGQI